MFRKNFKKGESCETSVKHGFSLVELLVVITIIAIMSIVAYTAVGGQTVKARDARRKQDITTIQQALELYYAENGKYPTPSGTNALQSGSDISLGQIPKKYLSDIPKDPGTANHDYVYVKKITGDPAYQIAATLEGTGEVATFQSYVVGNSDAGLIEVSPTIGYYTDGTALLNCTQAGVPPLIYVTTGNIARTNSGSGGTAPSTCVPYKPNL